MSDLTIEQEIFIRTKLSSKMWRMNNLYTIRDKDGIKRILKLNASQNKVLTDFKHNKKIICKSRQQGISTLYLAYYLDDCLFKEGFQAGIQSYGNEEAKKLQKRAELMWDDLDDSIKDLLGLTMVSNNSNGMTFSNGSVLRIGNFRGDTLQALHVSELGKIAKKYPDKAKELKTGAFQAVGKNNKITIESTAEGKTGLFYEMWEKAILKRDLGKKLTSLDFQPIFLSWLEDPDCTLYEKVEPDKEHIEYIDRLEADLKIQLTKEQINWLCSKLDELGDDFDQEYPATPDRAFAQSVEGTYFKKQYHSIIKEKRVKPVEHIKGVKVDVSFDLGLNDEMVLHFVQVIDNRPVVINEYHNTGEGFKFYIDILELLQKEHSYEYNWFILPHDANVRELGTGLTRIETLRSMGMTKIKLLPKLPFIESINVCRSLLNAVIINSKCENTILAVQNYRKKFDKTLGVYMNTDVHDIHSNYMASLRYMAQGLGYEAVKGVRANNIKRKKHKNINKFNGFKVI